MLMPRVQNELHYMRGKNVSVTTPNAFWTVSVPSSFDLRLHECSDQHNQSAV